ncbi:MAG TPA: Type 1 glutamine amidotransferase-like domain-containing protein [Verrucomicrobiae bacterium]|nr:Type 1 glutamine amidotransferase-like domain-containing protein [Verrucomicrobiae bacterium]
MRPIYLLADSQLLFLKQDGVPFLKSIVDPLDPVLAQAAYIGAANGDDPEFYQIFQSAMESVGIRNCRQICSTFSPAEKALLEAADIILLAGGDIEKGWNAFQLAGITELLRKKYKAGSTILGISAGAILLGLSAWRTETVASETIFDALNLVPLVIGVHEEKTEWANLRKRISLGQGFTRGIGIGAGAGMIFHPDQSVEPIRRPLHEFYRTSLQVCSGLLVPKGQAATP